MIRKAFILYSFAVVSCTSCYYDSEDVLYPVKTKIVCDTTGITFSSDISPLLDNHCNNCHARGIGLGGVVLEGYSHVKIYADAGSLLGSVEHKPSYFPMPRGTDQLDACSIAVIQAWIIQGAPDN